jgi:hypothetical protein
VEERRAGRRGRGSLIFLYEDEFMEGARKSIGPARRYYLGRSEKEKTQQSRERRQQI